MDAYADFLRRKAIVDPPTGLTEIPELPACLFPHQRDIVRWALRRGRAALFAGIGSEVWCAANMGRRGIGFELKESYFRQAVKNLAELDAEMEAMLA